MEDPWVNAWGDSQKSTPENATKSQPTAISWTSSSNFVTDDQTDIAVPSWEPEVGSTWDDSPDPQKNLWTRDNYISQLWTTPTFDSIEFAKPSQDSLSEHLSQTPPRSPSLQQYDHSSPELDHTRETTVAHEAIFAVTVDHSTADSQAEPASPSEIRESFPEHIAEESEGSRTSSPGHDAFGTFEVAVDDHTESDPWDPANKPSHELKGPGEWDRNWREPDEAVDEANEEPIDEWELAKRQKEMQDRYVPPELLDSILRHFEVFTGDYWSENASEDSPAVYQPCRDDLTETLSITSIVDRIIPSDLTLPALMPFTKTFVSKEMNETLKLTRHNLITRKSPLAVYMNTKGSLSWEASVKSKPDVTEADVVPSGWRIVPKESGEQQQPTNDTKKKAPGGLLSFFGRKSTANAPASGSSSPTRSSTPVGTSPRSSATSPRPSIDINVSDIASSSKSIVTTMGKETSTTILSATMSAITEVSRTSQADPQLMTPEPEDLTQAPSAVSRFFGRFSRSNRSSINSRNSLTLSSDDLEFLSDIIPSAQDEEDEPNQLNSPPTTIRPPSVPPKLPPPLAPPPRATPLPKLLSPPPPDSRPLGLDAHVSSRDHPSSIQTSIESQLFDLVPDISPAQPQLSSASQKLSAPFITIPSPHMAAPSAGSSHLSPSASSHLSTPPIQPSRIPLTQPSRAAFDDDEFSDFQTSPGTDSTAPMTALGQFISPAPIQSQKTNVQLVSFDDFDDFVSPPPRVPEKPSSISNQTPIILPTVRSTTPISPVKSASPTKQLGLHARRLSRQADSDQRTLNLLESAAARGKWPAPPSPLPVAIPPPTSQNSGTHLLDTIEPNKTHNAERQTTGLNLLTSRNSASSPILSPSPPGASAISVNHTGGNDARNGLGLSGTRNLPPPIAPAIPAPQIPPHAPMKPVPPLPHAQSQAQRHDKSLQPQQQWKIPSLPMAKPLSLSSTLGRSHGGSPSGQQQQPGADAFSSLFSVTAPLTPGIERPQNTAPSGGKLSAQDLSFFEGL